MAKYGPRPTPPTERFWPKVAKTDRCWNWTGATSRGYGYFYLPEGRVVAHRYAYEELVGAIPDGMELDHTCFNRGCVNPDHLRPVSHKQNNEHRSGVLSNNTSGVCGVHWEQRTQRWRAEVVHHGQRIRLGRFKDLAEAEAAVIAKRNELFTHNDMDRQ